jgi:hypothetical protein
MNKLKHQLSDEELIQDLSERNSNLQCDLVAEIESNRDLRNEKDNLKLRLEKLEKYQWLASLTAVFFALLFLVTLYYLSQEQGKARHVKSLKQNLYPKAVQLIDRYNVDKIRLSNHLVLEGMNRSEQKCKIDTDRDLRLNNHAE